MNSTTKVEQRGVWQAKYLGDCRYSVKSPSGQRGIYTVDHYAMGHTEAAAEAVRLHCDRIYRAGDYYGLLGDHLDMVGGLLTGDTYAFAVRRHFATDQEAKKAEKDWLSSRVS